MNSEVVSESHAQYNGGKRLAGSAVACRAPAYGRRIGVLGIRAGIPATLETMLGRRLVAWLRPEEVRTTRDLLSEGADERVLAAACDLKQRGANTLALACSGYSTIGIAGEPLPRLCRSSLRTVTVCDFSAAPLVSPGPGRSRLPAGTRTSANLRHCAVARSSSAAHSGLVPLCTTSPGFADSPRAYIPAPLPGLWAWRDRRCVESTGASPKGTAESSPG